MRNSIIRNFGYAGIDMGGSTSTQIAVDDVTFTGNGFTSTYAAIDIVPTGAAVVRLTVNRSQINGNAVGIYTDSASTTGSVLSIVRDSMISGGTYGIVAFGSAGLFSTISIDNTTIGNNSSYGLWASGAHGGILVNLSNIVGNAGGGLHQDSGGVIYSYGGNRVNGNNGNDGTFTGVLPQH